MNLSVNRVSKHYNKGKKLALDDFSMELTPGVVGLLGPNGAGKSTLMNIMTDNLKPDSGEVTFNGEAISRLGWKFRNILGYMPQQQGLYDDFSGRRFLWYMAALKGMKKPHAAERIEHLLEVVNLKQDASKRLGSYSGGMKQRILIAQALLNDPQILILDEPTAGLDPKERIRIRNFISTIARNKIVLLATHVVTDIEFIAKQVVLIKEGKMLLQDEPNRILEGIKDKVFELHLPEEELPKVKEQYKVSNITGDKEGVLVRIVSDHEPDKWKSVAVKPNMEDVYLYHLDKD
ncbi:ABC-type multidrug transport system ATPase subunit [Fontibacillus phaseoli]|uniref:ABC-type multidrug transport system ATPase subunit n=1 Tax=Fontibacillus phaseoli TaxID=1416533 RepID=A0A369B7W6_9BACL|nr:ABC transporter ATP-binding protein [Fontibacillus phaseoli]RCX16688.1 ABC-type multidrug transport system ATPase subunit [Fontibacillus phaseoli]